ncbi:MAG: MFS transporter [Acidisphaera sp.]|nr:MFS transporter [Acidisphaera sp.]
MRWWIAFGLIGPITFVMSLDRTAIVVAAPTIQHEYGFSLVEMGWILTSFSWTYAFLQVPAGWLAEHWGPRRALFAANALWSLLTAATPLGFSVASFVGIRALLGVGQAADWPASVLALKRWFPAAERSRGNSVLLGGLYLGPIAAAPLTTLIIAALSWRYAFVLFGAVGIVLGFLWYTAFRDSPREHPSITPEEADYIAAGQADRGIRPPPGAFGRCLGSVQFWAVGVQYFFLVLIQSFYTTWLPTYLVQERGLSLKSMGVYASLPWVALFIMVFVTGRLADWTARRTGSVWRARVPFAIAGFVVSALALIAATRVSDVVPMMLLLCVSLGAIGLTQVSIWSATQDLGGAATGVVSGWTNCWGNAAGFVGPVLTAYLVGWTGSWAGAVLGIAGAGLAGALLWLLVRPQRPIPALHAALGGGLSTSVPAA